MPNRVFNFFSPVGRAFDVVVNAVEVSREVQRLNTMSDEAFQARGTTRDAAIRAAIRRI